MQNVSLQFKKHHRVLWDDTKGNYPLFPFKYSSWWTLAEAREHCMPLANAQGSVCGEKIPFFSGFPVQLHTLEQWELVEGHFFGGGGGEWESYKSIHYFVDKKKKKWMQWGCPDLQWTFSVLPPYINECIKMVPLSQMSNRRSFYLSQHSIYNNRQNKK